MPHANEKIIEVIQSALDLEFSGEYFYRRAAEVTQHPQGKAMFLRLATQEQGHVAEIGSLCVALIGEKEWEVLLAERSSRPRSSPVVSQLEAAVAARGHGEVADDTQALRLAMELERRAVQFFENLKNYASDSETLKMIQSMADEERYHYDFLQAQLDSVLNVGVWLNATEFRMDSKY